MSFQLVPPEDFIYTGGGNFQNIGNEFFRYLIDLGGLQPHHKVLDVGCGIGRLAIPLTHYLNREGSYKGLDIVRLGIEWCRNNITTQYPKFQFHLADLFNRSYNPHGRYEASEYAFPFPRETFDMVCLVSVFTHMLPPEVENYLYEIARVLKRNGQCLITYFLWNQESSQLHNQGECAWEFKFDKGLCRTISRHRPEDAVCFDEPYILELYKKFGLQIDQPIRYGFWCGRPAAAFQDMILAKKIVCWPARKPRVAPGNRLALACRRAFFGQIVARFRGMGKSIQEVEIQRHIQARKIPPPKIGPTALPNTQR
jgi:SAM-dependent methyltransferase